MRLGSKISWTTDTSDDLEYSLFNLDDEFQETSNFQVHFSGVMIENELFDNYTSTLYILTPLIVNETNITCNGEASIRNISGLFTEMSDVTTRVCVTGNSHCLQGQVEITQ